MFEYTKEALRKAESKKEKILGVIVSAMTFIIFTPIFILLALPIRLIKKLRRK